jgi:hypothetical protein
VDLVHLSFDGLEFGVDFVGNRVQRMTRGFGLSRLFHHAPAQLPPFLV